MELEAVLPLAGKQQRNLSDKPKRRHPGEKLVPAWIGLIFALVQPLRGRRRTWILPERSHWSPELVRESVGRSHGDSRAMPRISRVVDINDAKMTASRGTSP